MSYRKSAEEIKWVKWKETEERKLRVLGVDEDVITRLRASDWEAFNEDRRYQQWQTVSNPLLELQPYVENEVAMSSVQNLLDSIENERLLEVLMKTDPLTIQILLYRMMGLSGKQIGQKIGLDEFSVKQRIYRLRKKIKNIF